MGNIESIPVSFTRSLNSQGLVNIPPRIVRILKIKYEATHVKFVGVLIPLKMTVPKSKSEDEETDTDG